jgi:hypothetical protein
MECLKPLKEEKKIEAYRDIEELTLHSEKLEIKRAYNTAYVNACVYINAERERERERALLKEGESRRYCDCHLPFFNGQSTVNLDRSILH